MMTLYKILAGVTSVLAIVGMLLVWLGDLPDLVGSIIAFVSIMAVISVFAVLGLLKDNPRSDKSVRR